MKPRAILISLLLLLLSATVLWAEDDPPGRVARLQYVSGSVSVQPQGTGDWAEAVVNRPVTSADNIWTDKDSRAELSVGTGILRMNSESSLTFTNLNDRTIQVQLHQGTLTLHLRKLYDGEIYEIDTPNMAFTVQKSGDYRFDVQPEGDASTVTVWKGKGDATGDGPAVRVESHESATFSNGTTLTHTFASAPALDGFDDWCVVRDKREDTYDARYVSPDMIGAGDLDEYGTWSEVPEYGAIWVPRHVEVGWAPYRYGHWVWVSPWGWSWVDDAPWGFAPFHYGRWVYYNNYWGWAPGPIYGRPVYAPALVAWFGGPGWGVSLGFGGGPGYGWCPLGFGEPFFPWYHGSRDYFRNVNIHNTRITNITNVTNIYAGGGTLPNRYINMRGATAVPERTLLGSRPVASSMVRLPQNDFNRAPHGPMNLAPTRTSMLGVNAGRPTAVPPQRTFARPVVSNVRMPQNNAREGTFNRPTGPVSGAMPQNGGSVRAPIREAEGARPGAFGGTIPARNVPRPPEAGTPRSGAIGSGSGSAGSFTRPEATRNAPRPPSATMTNQSPRTGVMDSNQSGSMDRGRFSRTSEPVNNVPRPPAGVQNNGNGNGHTNAPQGSAAPVNAPHPSGGQSSGPAQPERGVTPRAPANESTRPAPPSNNGGQRSSPPANNVRQPEGSGRSMYVPRPTGRVLPAGNQNVDYSRSQSGRGSVRDNYQGSSRGYSAAPRSYGSNGSSRSYGSSGSAPRSYSSSPRYSAPSGGGRSGGGGSSYHGGGGGSSSHSSGGGHSRGRA